MHSVSLYVAICNNACNSETTFNLYLTEFSLQSSNGGSEGDCDRGEGCRFEVPDPWKAESVNKRLEGICDKPEGLSLRREN